MIELNKGFFLAQGGERDCYIHPTDENKLIKIMQDKNKTDQNSVDEIYYNILIKNKVSFSNIPKCYGYIETNLGKGLIFDRILNYDRSLCKSFRYMIAHKLISMEEQKKLIEDLKNYLFNNKILFVDSSLTNILYQKKNENESSLIIIDGLGAKRMGFKFWLYRISSLYTNYKIKKQWSKFMSSYKSDIKRINNGNNPPIKRY